MSVSLFALHAVSNQLKIYIIGTYIRGERTPRYDAQPTWLRPTNCLRPDDIRIKGINVKKYRPNWPTRCTVYISEYSVLQYRHCSIRYIQKVTITLYSIPSCRLYIVTVKAIIPYVVSTRGPVIIIRYIVIIQVLYDYDVFRPFVGCKFLMRFVFCHNCISFYYIYIYRENVAQHYTGDPLFTRRMVGGE